MSDGHERASRERSGRFTKTLESAERDREACRMRSRGMTYQEISDQLGYGGEGNARRAVKETLAAVRVEGATELRALQAQQLDHLTAVALKILETVHPAITQSGRIIKDDNGNTLIDDGPVLAAIDRLLRIQERRAKLLNLDLREQVTDDADVDAEIRALLDRLVPRTET